MSSGGPSGSIVARAIAPTIVVGLGGLGREVIFRTRRRLYERYRRTTLPVASFLWLDHNTEVDPTPELPARVARKVALAADDRVSLTLTDRDLDAVLRDPSALPEGGTWLPAAALAKTRGAVRSRLLGRLAFHRQEAAVVARLRALAAALDAPSAHAAAAEAGFPTEQRPGAPEVVLVTSLAGGLGSGALLPLAQAVRAALPQAHIRAVLFLSGLFMAHDVSRRQLAMANGWAALREVRAAQRRAAAPAPFDALYLIDRENLDGSRPIDPLEPLEMVAESLTLEVSRSGTAAAVRGVRYAAHTGADFASFGLATMAPGGGRLRSAVAYLLGAELLERWAAGGRPEVAAAAGLEGGWPEAALAGAASDLREEYETYDIPPVEERNQPLPAPTDLRPLLLKHLREEFGLAADAPEEVVFAETGDRFVAGLRAAPLPASAAAVNGAEEAWEGFMDRLERFALSTCHQFDRRMANADPIFRDVERADAVARLVSWSEPWTPLRDDRPGRAGGHVVVGSGLPAESPLRKALPEQDIRSYHPGAVLRYRETGPIPPVHFATLRACQEAWSKYAAQAGDAIVHRHTVANPETLPDPLAE
jgi:hypothetical protein